MGKFLYKNDAIVTVMVQSDEPDGIKALMDKAAPSGAEAFGVQTETLRPEFKTEKVLRGLFSYKSVPTYVTNYRYGTNSGKSDEALADELVALAEKRQQKRQEAIDRFLTAYSAYLAKQGGAERRTP